MTVRTTSQYLTLVSLSVAFALFLKWSLISVYRIPSKSMSPTLIPGDFVIVNKAAYGFKFTPVSSPIVATTPEYGDIVLMKLNENSGTYYIKRVIGKAGDIVEIKSGQLIVSGKEFHAKKQDVSSAQNTSLFEVFNEGFEGKNWSILRSQDYSKKNFGPFTVPAGHYFVLGDNRDSSEDSRQWGAIALSLIKGRVSLVGLSVDWQDSEGRGRMKWDRFLSVPK
ncbi:MAG: signal peptidase I [Bdellovibrionaceae bacterium]|nr:signal peptidase I [Pseudobdellovibrionaceae bacterium]